MELTAEAQLPVLAPWGHSLSQDQTSLERLSSILPSRLGGILTAHTDTRTTEIHPGQAQRFGDEAQDTA